jgi:enamine deaminase RidA (YjgF/YER057c/UK114 family)
MSDPLFHNFSAAPTHVAPFSHAVECEGWIQLTGQMPTDPDDDSRSLPDGIESWQASAWGWKTCCRHASISPNSNVTTTP